MYQPNYGNGSIVNLMSSITTTFGDRPLYESLSTLTTAELSTAKNVVLWVIDGLGYEYLLKYGQQTLFYEGLRDKLTSVFPSTTAAGVTTFVTGVAPQQHALTGWFVYLKELGTVTAILPFKPRHGGFSFGQTHIKAEDIFDQPSVFSKIKAASYVVMPQELVKSAYNGATLAQTNVMSYRSLSGCLTTVRKIILTQPQQKYIYVYWPKFDALSHHYGNNSQEVRAHFDELDKKLRRFLKSLARTETILIITADHGFIDTEPAKRIELKQHPRLLETLTLPLCGEARATYCYVRPNRVAQFEAYVAEHFSDQAELVKSEELIAKNYFGLFDPNPKLFERVGDYVLLMKENYIIKDFILGERECFDIGYHGGVSREEMFVPLMVIKT